MAEPLLQIEDLEVHFPVRSGFFLRQTAVVKAVDGVSLGLGAGETLGLVGESGCGKSTLGRTIVSINNPTAGRVKFNGDLVSGLRSHRLAVFRRNVQMIFQDPYSSLNPRMTVGNIVRRPLDVHSIGTLAERRHRVDALLERVGLGNWALNRYPHEFSGGQRQRIAIARAIAIHPKIIIADEPVSALDVSVQAQILNLLKDLGRELGMSYLFIAHNLAVVQHMSDRVAVMYLGRIVELTTKAALFNDPKHPYTIALIAANPTPGAGRKHKRASIGGDVPSPINPPSGCHFHPRCPMAMAQCRDQSPKLKNVGTEAEGHLVACNLYL